MLLYVVACVIVALGLLWSYWGQYILAGSKIPGPAALPLFGNLLSVSSDPEKVFHTMYSLHKNHGRLVRFWGGPKLAVFMTDPVDIQAVLGNPNMINRDYFLQLPVCKIMGNGLIANRDEQWKSHRKLLTPAFHFKVLQGYIDNFGKLSEELVERLELLTDGRTFNPLNEMGQVTLDSIKDAVFGTNVDWSESATFMDLFIKAGNVMAMCAVRPWLLFDWAFKRTENGKIFFDLRQKVNERTGKLISQRVEEFRKVDKAVVVDEDATRPFMDVLIEESEREGSAMTIDELQEELNTLIIAAIDTSATTMSGMLALMGMYPEIQQQVIDEVDSIFGSDTRRATPDDLNRMFVIERVLKETLRLFPTAPWINREVSEEMTLPSGYVLPSWSLVMVFAYAVHRDPDNYVDPGKFWPDRWLPENSVNRHPYAFVPFGAGKRICIGQKYAYLQMKTVVSGVFRKYRVTSDQTLESLDRMAAGPVIRPVEGHLIQIHRRGEEKQ